MIPQVNLFFIFWSSFVLFCRDGLFKRQIRVFFTPCQRERIPPYPIIELLTSHAPPDIYIIGSGLSDPSSSLPATQGISDTGRSPPAAPIAEPRHTQDMEPAEITTTQMMHGPGSSRSNPIFIDSDLEDTFEHPYSTRTIPSPPSTRIWRIPSNTRVLHGPIPSPPSTRNRRAPAS